MARCLPVSKSCCWKTRLTLRARAKGSGRGGRGAGRERTHLFEASDSKPASDFLPERVNDVLMAPVPT